MTERPMPFSAPMVRAILAGNKTQTRLIVKPQPNFDAAFSPGGIFLRNPARAVRSSVYLQPNIHSPYGLSGDRLWVRETWQHSNYPEGPYDERCLIFYRADYLDDPEGPDREKSVDGFRRKWKPSIHMPRTAARILLKITNVRVQQVQAITEDEARREGIVRDFNGFCVEGGSHYHAASARRSFASLWDSKNEKHGHGWDANPWVWVIEFEVMK